MTSFPKAPATTQHRVKAAEVAPEEPQGIQSVEIGLGVLDALVNAGRAMPLGFIARSAGLSTSQARRYLVSLIRAGVAQQDTASGLYDLGAGALRIGLAALGRVDAVDLAAAALRKLTAETAEGGSLAIWGEHGATVIRWFRGEIPGPITIGLGSIFPLYASATGRVFLAYLPEDATRHLLDHELGPAAATREMRMEIRRSRAQVRKQGYAALSGHFISEIRGLSAPILDAQGEIVAAIAIVGPPRAGGKGEADPSLSALLEASQAVSRQLGFKPENFDR